MQERKLERVRTQLHVAPRHGKPKRTRRRRGRRTGPMFKHIAKTEHRRRSGETTRSSSDTTTGRRKKNRLSISTSGRQPHQTTTSRRQLHRTTASQRQPHTSTAPHTPPKRPTGRLLPEFGLRLKPRGQSSPSSTKDSSSVQVCYVFLWAYAFKLQLEGSSLITEIVTFCMCSYGILCM